jgi:hypothetical protein
MARNPRQRKHVDATREARQRLSSGIVEVKIYQAGPPPRLAEYRIDLRGDEPECRLVRTLEAPEEIDRLLRKRNVARFAVLRMAERDKAPVKVDLGPAESADLAAAHGAV